MPRGLQGRLEHGSTSATKERRGCNGASRHQTLGRSWHDFTRHNRSGGVLVCRLTPEPGGPSRNDYGPPNGYKLAYSVPCPTPYHHLPEEAPHLHTPVHVPLHVTPKWGVLPPFQVSVRYNQD